MEGFQLQTQTCRKQSYIEYVYSSSSPETKEGDVSRRYYGSNNEVFMAMPDAWINIKINRTDYVIPCYLASEVPSTPK